MQTQNLNLLNFSSGYILIKSVISELNSPTQQTAPMDAPAHPTQVKAQINTDSLAQPPSSLPLKAATTFGSPPTAPGAAAASPSAGSVSSDFSVPVLLEEDSTSQTGLFGKWHE